jgi:hypothetical protein
MPALHATAALPAVADMNPELPHDRLPRDLGLELLGQAGFDEGAPAMRAGVGQRSLVTLADLFGSGRRPVAVTAVLGTGLATGTLRLGFGRPFAERSGLTLAGADSCLQASAQLAELSLEFSDLLLQGPTIRAGGFVHPAIVGTDGPFSCANLASRQRQPTRDPLNNYLHS